ncbi:MAG: carboxypeptidase-like regulatory domain-containing protein [Flavobacteriaceae bacterium]|nr:carboxypeptidase-like regulatory domain-containing protein [Flavobacteriaceae bacterium]
MIKYILLFLPIFVISQTELEIKGTIIDSNNETKLINADVYFKNYPYGTTSNNNGEFKFNFNKISKNDTLIVSYLGYKEFKIKVYDFLKLKDTKIYLVEYVTLIDEIIISNANPLTILKQSAANYDHNHFTNSITYKGTVIQVSQENKTITRLSYSDILLKTTKRQRKKNTIIPIAKQYKKEKNSKLSEFSLIKLYQLVDFLKLKNKISYFIKNYSKFDEVLLSEKKYGAYSIYEINLIKNINSIKKTKISFFIEKTTKSIISLKLEGDRIEQWHFILDENDEKIKRKPIFSTGEIVFRPYKEKWILKEIKTSLNVSYNIESNGQKQNIENYNEARIIINGLYNGIAEKNRKFDLHVDIFNQIRKIETNFLNIENRLNSKELKFIRE